MIKTVLKGGLGKDLNYKEFIISSSADVPSLPTSTISGKGIASAGSVAYTQDMSSCYMLGPDGIWREV